MMARYIDAELFDKKLAMEVYLADDEDFTKAFVRGMELVKKAENETPTADVQEVRYGKWILRGGWSRCSECDGKALLKDVGGTGGPHEYDQVRSDICPYCGAKMDLED